MIKIEVNKEDLERFVDSLEKDFNNLKNKCITFKEFKLYFCDDSLIFDTNNFINGTLKKKKIENIKGIYKNISSSNSLFYKKIREKIITSFTDNVKFCPYCGKVPLISYETTKDKNKDLYRMFQFDHFFPKNQYHKGIINFYNLIPSCNACNHLKLDKKPLDSGRIFHPYFGWIFKNGNKIRINKDSFDKKVSFIKSSTLIYTKAHSGFFKLAQIYFNSQDTFSDFNFLQDIYTKIKASKLNFKAGSISDQKYIKHFLENYYPQKESDILKYSNGKFKKDIIEQIREKILKIE